MLFNTLLYAKFFAVVFGVSWLLRRARTALFLPWFLVASYGLLTLRLSAALVSVFALAVTVILYRRPFRGRTERDTRRDDGAPISWAHGLLCLVANLGPLGALLWHDANRRQLPELFERLSSDLARFAILSPLVLVLGLAALLHLMTSRRARLLFLLGASYVFYAHWDYRFLPLIWASSSIDWLLGNAIALAKSERSRKHWLAGTVILNLGVLGIFKYFNFGVETTRRVLAEFGLHPPEIALEIALPIGISFFTFESMSYVIDVYRRHIKPHPSYVEYLSFVAFFPHLVAGPIVRPRDLLPQLAGEPKFNVAEGSEALFLIALGLIKKVAIGDYLALNLVDRVFDAPEQYSALECYAGVLGYAVQIYCDFSGYTDIAIGSALLLGIRFPQNFNAPYKAVNLIDFWRRWHISLSTWLRDYLYIPLGGNRDGAFRTYRNVLITMLLGGLWHGASFTFVAWGGLHGIGIAVTRAWQERRQARSSQHASRWPSKLLSAVLTFHFVCAGWIFFRAPTFSGARAIFGELATLSTHHTNLPWPVVGVLAVGLFSHWVPENWYRASLERYQALPALAQGVLLFGAAWVLRQMASADAVPFVYFQF